MNVRRGDLIEERAEGTALSGGGRTNRGRSRLLDDQVERRPVRDSPRATAVSTVMGLRGGMSRQAGLPCRGEEACHEPCAGQQRMAKTSVRARIWSGWKSSS